MFMLLLQEGERYRLQLNNLQELLRRCEKELADSRQNAVHLTQQLHLTQLQVSSFFFLLLFPFHFQRIALF